MAGRSAPSLIRIRWAVRAVLALGIAASITGNVLHALDNPISQAIAAWPPLALLLTVELISRVPVHRRAVAVARFVATATIAGIAGWVSYWHMAGVASRYGETGASPFLLPVSVDGLIVVASICLVELGGRIAGMDQSPVREVRPTVEAKAAPAQPAKAPVPAARPVQEVQPAPVRKPVQPARSTPTGPVRSKPVPPRVLDMARELDRRYPGPLPGRREVMPAMGWSSAGDTQAAINHLKAERAKARPVHLVPDPAEDADRAAV